jgi:hypothetical protein
MLYMVIETFYPGQVRRLYERFEKHGRLLPPGVRYVSSWIDRQFTRCFQVMECADPALLDEWAGHWSDLADFEIIPVLSSDEARCRITESSET